MLRAFLILGLIVANEVGAAWAFAKGSVYVSKERVWSN
jgi:hypothetical protein